MDRLDGASNKYDPSINFDKFKAKTTDGMLYSIRIRDNVLEQVDTFPHLGSLFTDCGECTKVIRSRLPKLTTLEQHLNISGRITAFVFPLKSVS